MTPGKGCGCEVAAAFLSGGPEVRGPSSRRGVCPSVCLSAAGPELHPPHSHRRRRRVSTPQAAQGAGSQPQSPVWSPSLPQALTEVLEPHPSSPLPAPPLRS